MNGHVRHCHPCQACGAKTPCDGPLEDNYDGFPAIICRDFHRVDGELNPDFRCEGCEWAHEERVMAECDR